MQSGVVALAGQVLTHIDKNHFVGSIDPEAPDETIV
jgi:hypothetical protein